jgi:hypothetical protein
MRGSSKYRNRGGILSLPDGLNYERKIYGSYFNSDSPDVWHYFSLFPHLRAFFFLLNNSFQSSSTASSGCSRQDILCPFVSSRWKRKTVISFSFLYRSHARWALFFYSFSFFLFKKETLMAGWLFKWIVSACGIDDGPTNLRGQKVQNL